jgi:hypothetical protein
MENFSLKAKRLIEDTDVFKKVQFYFRNGTAAGAKVNSKQFHSDIFNHGAFPCL